MESPYLHSDIISEILSRTSSETHARFRLASNEWNLTTYDSKFKKVRSQKTNIVDGFFVTKLFRSECVPSFASISDETRKISLGFIPGSDVRVMAVSANSGILICKSKNSKQPRVPRFFVCKPQVESSHQIPNPRTRFFAIGMAMSVLCTNPFRCKILRISKCKVLVKNCQQLILEIFDSKAWKWKRLKDVSLPDRVWLFSLTTVIEASGAFHWLLSNDLTFSFDVEKEEWKITSLPIVEDDYRRINIVKYEGKLALMCMDMEGYMHTWVLESYINMAWKKRFVINMKEPGSTYVTYTPLAFYGSDIVVVDFSSSLKYYDFKNEKFLTESKLEKNCYCDVFPFWSDSEPCCFRQGREHDIRFS